MSSNWKRSSAVSYGTSKFITSNRHLTLSKSHDVVRSGRREWLGSVVRSYSSSRAMYQCAWENRMIVGTKGQRGNGYLFTTWRRCLYGGRLFKSSMVQIIKSNLRDAATQRGHIRPVQLDVDLRPNKESTSKVRMIGCYLNSLECPRNENRGFFELETCNCWSILFVWSVTGRVHLVTLVFFW
jgi:hypothetical protein